jgi:hypothetical protein
MADTHVIEINGIGSWLFHFFTSSISFDHKTVFDHKNIIWTEGA